MSRRADAMRRLPGEHPVPAGSGGARASAEARRDRAPTGDKV